MKCYVYIRGSAVGEGVLRSVEGGGEISIVVASQSQPGTLL